MLPMKHGMSLSSATSATLIHGIGNYWSQAKRHLRRYNGIARQHFHLFLKECEWRFNGGSPNDLLRTLKQWVKIRSQGNI